MPFVGHTSVPNVASRDLLDVVAKVFAAHVCRLHLHHILGSNDLACGGSSQLGGDASIDESRRSSIDLYFNGCAVQLCDGASDSLNRCLQTISHFRLLSTNRALQNCLIGDDIAGGTRIESSDSDNRGMSRIDFRVYPLISY